MNQPAEVPVALRAFVAPGGGGECASLAAGAFMGRGADQSGETLGQKADKKKDAFGFGLEIWVCC